MVRARKHRELSTMHEYHCSVCQRSYGTRTEWLSHLLQDYHQTKARKEICRWTQSERECALVAFTTLPISSFDLLQFFSKGATNLVTDFVWFANRPEMGFLQFESRHKVEEILAGFGGPEVRINKQLVQVKKAGECLELEWQLLTKLAPSELNEEFENVPDSDARKSTSPNPPVISSPSLIKVGKDIAEINQNPKAAKLLHSLVDHYHLICQAIEIPDHEYKTALQFLQRLETLLAKQFPSCKLIWFRNWFLKLKNTVQDNELILFFDQDGIFGQVRSVSIDLFNDTRERPPVNDDICHLFSSTPEAKRLGLVEAREWKLCEGLRKDDIALNFECRTNGLTFTVVPQESPVPEIQACRLLSYLCSFDPRVKPLLTVIRYWAKVNGISLAIPNYDWVGHPPDPAALDWLVIFFLTHKKGILPTPRGITRRPHKNLIFAKTDIGFDEDPKFARLSFNRYTETDEETHTFNIFNLAKDLFNFYSKELHLSERKLVLNTKDGEIIPMEELDKSISLIQTKLEGRAETKAVRSRVKLYDPPRSLVLLHPLYLGQGFSFCDKNFVTSVCPTMQVTTRKLKQALDNYKSGQNFDMRSALKVN